MPRIPNAFKESFHKTIVDRCFEPLTTKFYGQSFERSMFPSLYGNLVDGSLAQRLEALIGIHDILEKNPVLIAHIPKTTLLMKAIIILKERQFPQHIFEAIRLINLLINNQTNATQLIKAGGYFILMDLITLQPQNILMISAFWTCQKMKFYESQYFRYQARQGGEAVNLANKTIDKYNNSGEESIDEFVEMCSRKNRFDYSTTPEYFRFITVLIMEYIIKVKIRKQQIVQIAIHFIQRNSQGNHVSQFIQNKDYKEYEDLIQTISKLPPQFIVHYARLISQSIQIRKYPKLTYFFYSRQSTITAFQPLFYTQYNFQKEAFMNFLISVFKSKKKVALNYFKKRPEMVTRILELFISRASGKIRSSLSLYKSRRKGAKCSDYCVVCKALQLSYYVLCSDFPFYWPLYKKYDYLKITLKTIQIETSWSIAYEMFANELFMLKQLDEVEFALQLNNLNKQDVRSIMDKLKSRQDIIVEINFLWEYLNSL